MHTVNDVTGQTTHGYDGNDLLTSVAAPGATLGHKLDEEGNRTQLTGPNTGDLTGYAYDEVGNLASITVGDETTRFGYDDLGRENLKTLPNGIQVSRTWDAGKRARTRLSSRSFLRLKNFRRLLHSF